MWCCWSRSERGIPTNHRRRPIGRCSSTFSSLCGSISGRSSLRSRKIYRWGRRRENLVWLSPLRIISLSLSTWKRSSMHWSSSIAKKNPISLRRSISASQRYFRRLPFSQLWNFRRPPILFIISMACRTLSGKSVVKARNTSLLVQLKRFTCLWWVRRWFVLSSCKE